MDPKIRAILKVLDRLYPAPPVPLNSKDVFTFLCAVVLSAQTTDGKVNEVTHELFRVAPTPQLMSIQKIEDVQRIIQPVGLAPGKAKNLVNMSKMLLEKFDGNVPNNYADLESLPGVGHKTASVLMSQSFGEEALAVDTHVHRLSLRWKLTRDEKDPTNVQRDLCRQFPQSMWNKLHLQMIYFGREYCPAKNHEPRNCPICSWVNRPVPIAGEEYITKAEIDTFKANHKFQKAKGIVYYSDRTEELIHSPKLSNPVSPLNAKKGNRSISSVDLKAENLFSELHEAETKVEVKTSSRIKSKGNDTSISSSKSSEIATGAKRSRLKAEAHRDESVKEDKICNETKALKPVASLSKKPKKK